MNRLFADAKPSADVEYLASAIIRDAVKAKFRDLFGRDPVEKSVDLPLVIDDTRVPDMILESVDSHLAKTLKASAVEVSDNAEGSVPDINNATLLYTILDNDPAQVSLEAVKEYQALDSASRDSTAQAVGEQGDIYIENGVAYVDPDRSGIKIGIFVANDLFAEEFQYRLAAMGGNEVGTEEKLKVFEDLYSGLPGGDKLYEDAVKSKLMAVVGLGKEAPAGSEAQDAAKAPGPEPVTETPAQKTESLITFESIVEDAIKQAGFGWKKVSSFLRQAHEFLDDEIEAAQSVYATLVAEAAVCEIRVGMVSIVPGTVVGTIDGQYVVKSILVKEVETDLVVEDPKTGIEKILSSKEIVTY